LRSEKALHRLYWLFILANACDILSTEGALALGLIEANPIARILLDILGYFGLYALKCAYILMVSVIWGIYHHEHPKKVMIGVIIATIPLLVVTIWNLAMILMVIL